MTRTSLVLGALCQTASVVAEAIHQVAPVCPLYLTRELALRQSLQRLLLPIRDGTGPDEPCLAPYRPQHQDNARGQHAPMTDSTPSSPAPSTSTASAAAGYVPPT